MLSNALFPDSVIVWEVVDPLEGIVLLKEEGHRGELWGFIELLLIFILKNMIS